MRLNQYQISSTEAGLIPGSLRNATSFDFVLYETAAATCLFYFPVFITIYNMMLYLFISLSIY